ncbi:sorting nexin-24 [Crocuta crocuta]
MNGRKHFVEKRYSEFHALHKKLKKCIKTPEIPSKHVRNWVPKVLEQRRQGLETYLQAVILENEELPKLFLDFLNVRHLPSLPKAESCGSFDETESEESSKLSHQPVLLFLRDPFVLPAASDFPNVVIEGVLHGIFYPHLQPRFYDTRSSFHLEVSSVSDRSILKCRHQESITERDCAECEDGTKLEIIFRCAC